MGSAEQGFQHRTFTIKLWPPSQSTRTMLVERMTKNLTTESIFSRKYGLLSGEEACLDAKEIEEAGFAVANAHYEKEPDGDGSSAVQLYAKETSKRMLEVIKRGPRSMGNGDVSTIDRDSSLQKTVLDISGGKRAFLEGDEATELLKPLTEKGNSFTKICFSNRSFGLDAAHVAEPILASIKNQLTEVDLSDFVAGRPEEEALEVMRIFSSALEGCALRYLDLSNNALGEKGVRAFGSLLKSQESLENLYLMNDGISPEAADAIRELIPSTKKLKVLHFHNNMTGDDGAFAIADLVKHSLLLEDFRCSSSRVDSEGGIRVAESLGNCLHLRKLDIRDNMFGVDAGRVLSKTVLKLEDLTEVYLSYLNLEDEGTIAISNALKEAAPCLEVIDIAGNEITTDAVPALAGCIASKEQLKKLNLSENEIMDQGAVIIGKTLEKGHGYLKELDMSNNSIRRAGARCLTHAITNKAEFAFLNLNGNAISEEGIDEVREILKSGKNSVDVLGPLDENDVEEDEEDNEETTVEGGAAVGEDELESKLQHLSVEQ